MRLTLITFLVVLQGCASTPEQHWTHATKKLQEFYKDSSQCEAMSYNVRADPYPTSNQALLSAAYAEDARERIYNGCMKGNGWNLVDVKH